MLSAGDLKGSLRKLDSLLRSIKYPGEVDYNGLSKGDPSSFLPIVSFTLTSFSPPLAEQLVEAGLELTGKTDLRFTDTVYKILRDVFHYKPVLSKQQFLQCGFSQRKIWVVCDVISLTVQRHGQLSRPRPTVSRDDAPPLRGETAMNTDCPTLPARPLVERHVGGGPSPFHREPAHAHISPSHRPALENPRSADSEEKEEEEEEEEDVPMPLVVEGRLSALEAQMQHLLSGLERLSSLETRLDGLERRRDAGEQTVNETETVTVNRKSWENLLSRVLLLETAQELADAKRDASLVNGGSRRHAADEAPPTCHSNDREPSQSSAPFPISPGLDVPQEGLKDRLERISAMMKDTSSLLKNSEPAI